MAWVVDTCLLLDIGLDDPSFALKSEVLLAEKSTEVLVVCPVTFVELGPAFAGDLSAQRKFLFNLGVDFEEAWTDRDTDIAAKAWAKHILHRRARRSLVSKRPVADVLIGAFALRFDGLLTRNAADFRGLFPKLRVISPK